MNASVHVYTYMHTYTHKTYIHTSILQVDGSRCEEVCVVKENIARLLVSRSLKQIQPKGMTLSQIARFEVRYSVVYRTERVLYVH